MPQDEIVTNIQTQAFISKSSMVIRSTIVSTFKLWYTANKINSRENYKS